MIDPNLLAVLGEGLELVKLIAEKAGPGALEAVKGVVTSMLHTHAGDVKPSDLKASLKAFRDQLGTVDAKIDAAGDAKFPRKQG